MENNFFGISEDLLAHILSSFLTVKGIVSFAIACGCHQKLRHDTVASKRLLLLNVHFDAEELAKITPTSIHSMNQAFQIKAVTFDIGQVVNVPSSGRSVVVPIRWDEFEKSIFQTQINRIPFLIPALGNLEKIEIHVNRCNHAMNEEDFVTFFENLTRMFKCGYCENMYHIKVRHGNTKTCSNFLNEIKITMWLSFQFSLGERSRTFLAGYRGGY